MDEIRMLVVDDEALVRRALRIFVDGAAFTRVVGDARTGSQAIEETLRLRPDVVLMDIRLPEMDGIEATAYISEHVPDTRVIAITTFSSDQRVLEALQSGASGFLVKDTTPSEIVAAIIRVHRGESVLSPQLTHDLISTVLKTSPPSGSGPGVELTDRERLVVQLLARGMSNAEMSAELALGEATIKACMSRIMHKWGVRDRVQVLIHAVRTGHVRLSD